MDGISDDSPQDAWDANEVASAPEVAFECTSVGIDTVREQWRGIAVSDVVRSVLDKVRRDQAFKLSREQDEWKPEHVLAFSHINNAMLMYHGQMDLEIHDPNDYRDNYEIWRLLCDVSAIVHVIVHGGCAPEHYSRKIYEFMRAEGRYDALTNLRSLQSRKKG